MRLPLLFRRENSSAARREREEQLEKALTQGMRKLADLLKQYEALNTADFSRRDAQIVKLRLQQLRRQ